MRKIQRTSNNRQLPEMSVVLAYHRSQASYLPVSFIVHLSVIFRCGITATGFIFRLMMQVLFGNVFFPHVPFVLEVPGI